MAYYSLSRAHLQAELERIEQQGEEVVSAFPDGATISVITRKTGRFVSQPPMETR